MLWIRLRFLTVAALAVGIASGAAISYVRGSQEPAPQGEQPLSKRSTTKAAATSQPKTSKKAIGDPAASTPQPTLLAQQLVVRKAKALYEISKLTTELAEIAVEEYEKVSYPEALAEVEGELKLAESNLALVEDRVGQAKTRFKNKIVPPLRSEELVFQKARFVLEQVHSKKKVLEDYTRAKTVKELKSEVEKARSDELAKKATWSLEISKEMFLEREARLKTK